MKTQYYTAASLDGFVATETDSLDWLFALGDPENPSYSEFIAQIGALAMGATTYEWVCRHLTHGTPWPYSQPTWVFTHRELPRIPNAEIYFVQGEIQPVYDEIERAARGKNLWIAGGGGMAAQFYDANLLDEIIVQIASVTLGRGKPFLPRRISRPLQLLQCRPMGPSFVELHYAVPRLEASPLSPQGSS